MHVHYCTRADGTLASFRYRIMLPASELLSWGHDITISPEVVPADVVVFSKHFNPDDPALVRRARDLGARTVFDVCDDHFGGDLRGHYVAMCEAVDEIVANTPEMAAHIQAQVDLPAHVVIDPYEHPEQPPSFEPHAPPRLLWYGHNTNLDGLAQQWPSFAGCAVQVITNPTEGFNFPIVPWSPQTMRAGLRSCDLVIVPVATGDPRKKFKSANRMIEAVRNGKFVVASKLPAYEPLAEFMWVGTDLRKGIDWAIAHPDEVRARIRAAQRAVKFLFNPGLAARQWMEVFVEAKSGLRQKTLV